MLYPLYHPPQCAWCFVCLLQRTLPPPRIIILCFPSLHPSPRWLQQRSRNQQSNIYDGDEAKSYTSSYILRDLLVIVPIHNGMRYFLLTLLFLPSSPLSLHPPALLALMKTACHHSISNTTTISIKIKNVTVSQTQLLQHFQLFQKYCSIS